MGTRTPFHGSGRFYWGLLACLALGITWVRADRDLQLEGKNAEELNKVQAVIEKAVQADPGNSELWVHLGMVHRKADRVEDAQKAFEQAARLNPSNANAHFMLGLIFEKKGQTGKAISSWEACRNASKEEKMRQIAEKHLKILNDR